MGSLNGKNKLAIFSIRGFPFVPMEIIGTPAMRVFKRYVMPFSVYSVSQTTLSNVEGEWVVIKQIVMSFYEKSRENMRMGA
jgi:hypothetical protein